MHVTDWPNWRIPTRFAPLILHTPRAMGPVTFLLPDGATVAVHEEDVQRVYNMLWDISGLPGAVSTAALLLYESRQASRYRPPVALSAAQSEAIREAVARANPT
jgi:hypothetical protein